VVSGHRLHPIGSGNLCTWAVSFDAFSPESGGWSEARRWAVRLALASAHKPLVEGPSSGLVHHSDQLGLQ